MLFSKELMQQLSINQKQNHHTIFLMDVLSKIHYLTKDMNYIMLLDDIDKTNLDRNAVINLYLNTIKNACEMFIEKFNIKQEAILNEDIEIEKIIKDELKKQAEVKELESVIWNGYTISSSVFTDKELRKMAKKICNGHQHAMRYQNMLNACYNMIKMIIEELKKRDYQCNLCNNIDSNNSNV